MRHIAFAALYTALACLANGAAAQTAEQTAEQTLAQDFGQTVDGLRTGDMRKLIVHAAPLDGSARTFTTADGGEMSLDELQGQWVLVNFWATWCAPCRIEMPQLAALQSDYGSDSFSVVTIATGRNQPQAMQAFFNEIGVTNLPLHRDPRQELARDFGVLGLPVTLILNPQGQEVARLQGEAAWAAPEARAVIEAMLASN